MKVFISWSGETSHGIALVLRDWLPYVIQAVKPFVSDRDIAKGARWSHTLGKELEDTDFGIICVTPYNIRAPWLYFESGALSKSINHSSLIPFLFRIDRSHIHGPLAQFQATISEKEDIFNLLLSINSRLKPEEQIGHERLRRTFDQWWPQIQKAIDGILPNLEKVNETGYEWLYTPGDLSRIELDANCKAIWVVTPSPYQDLQLTCVRDVVQKNIDRGVKYTFIMPALDNESVRATLRQIFFEHKDQLRIKEVTPEIFQSLAVTHYLVLNPDYDDDGYNPRVLLELPTVQRDYWIEVATGAAFGFADRFRRMLEDTPGPIVSADAKAVAGISEESEISVKVG